MVSTVLVLEGIAYQLSLINSFCLFSLALHLAVAEGNENTVGALVHSSLPLVVISLLLRFFFVLLPLDVRSRREMRRDVERPHVSNAAPLGRRLGYERNICGGGKIFVAVFADSSCPTPALFRNKNTLIP